jgi:ATP-dependent Clp protease protease subunit
MPTKPRATASRPTKVSAEIERLLAERDFFTSNARVAKALAEQEEIALRVRQRAEIELLTRNDFHNVYVFDDDVDAQSVNQCVQTITGWVRQEPGCDIEIQLNTSGGSIFAGFALIDFIRDLRNRGHKVTAVVYGYAASMGAVILQAADHRVIGENAFLLIHEGSLFTAGDWGKVQDEMELFKKLQKKILTLLVTRSKLGETKIKNSWKRQDWWLTAEESLAAGFVDEVR